MRKRFTRIRHQITKKVELFRCEVDTPPCFGYGAEGCVERDIADLNPLLVGFRREIRPAYGSSNIDRTISFKPSSISVTGRET